MSANDGTPFIVMEYFGGGSLADRPRRDESAHDTAIAWLDQAAAPWTPRTQSALSIET